MKFFFIVSIFLFVLCVPAFAQTRIVKTVISGDILELTNGEIVRLIGIETPINIFKDRALEKYIPNETEVRQAEVWGVEFIDLPMMGQEATEFLKGLINPGEEIRLEFDVQERDKYGRLLAYVWYEITPNSHIKDMGWADYYEVDNGKWKNKQGYYGSFVHLNATIIKAGYASPMTIPPNVKYAELFKKLYEEAREQKRGLWRDKVKVTGCTEEAKKCPDGSYVARFPPKCEFRACPE